MTLFSIALQGVLQYYSNWSIKVAYFKLSIKVVYSKYFINYDIYKSPTLVVK